MSLVEVSLVWKRLCDLARKLKEGKGLGVVYLENGVSKYAVYIMPTLNRSFIVPKPKWLKYKT